MIYKIFGPPRQGHGKTTFLLNTVEQELDSGILPIDIGYFAFTRKAANEARDRAVVKFPSLQGQTDFPWFRTLHSLAYRCLGVKQNDMMSPEHYQEFGRLARLDMTVEETGEEEGFVKANNPILNEINLARIKKLDLRTHYNRSNLSIEWWHFEFVERTYRKYKEEHLLLDFTDLLENINLEPERLPRLKTVIVDEAQDLSPIQWDLVKNLIARSNETYIAGDDDQAIYSWAGADVKTFLELPGDIRVLDKSYRIPKSVHQLADQISSKIRQRQPKFWQAREEEGAIHYHNSITTVKVEEGSWFFLAAANYILDPLHSWLRSEGILFERNGHRSISENILSAVLGWESLRKGNEVFLPIVEQVYKHLGADFIKRGHKSLKTADPELSYSLKNLQDHHGLLTDAIWHEALTKISEEKRDYIIALLRRGIKLTSTPQVKLSTIHGAKGGEADHVVFFMDLSAKFAKEYDIRPDDMYRLAYVAATRAKKTLHIILPEYANKGFRL
jgi:DNA helicase-2/ATP-dependent DNA helicase PcrA